MTNRRPLVRRLVTPTFTLRAVTLWEALQSAKSESERWRLHDELHDELGLPPHVMFAIPMDGDCEDKAAVRRAEALRAAAESIQYNGSEAREL